MDVTPADHPMEAGGSTTDVAAGARAPPSKAKGRSGDAKPPGSTWNNKKARQDYIKAVEKLLDDKFSLSELTILCGFCSSSSSSSTTWGASWLGVLLVFFLMMIMYLVGGEQMNLGIPLMRRIWPLRREL